MYSAVKIRFIPLVLAFLVSMNVLGIYLIAFTQTGLHRLNEYASADQPTNTLSISVSDWKNVNWIGTEDFVYNGNVYDLDNVITSGDHVIVSCHLDQEETTMKKDLAENSNNDHSAIPNSLRDSFKFVTEYDGMPSFALNFYSQITGTVFPVLHPDFSDVLIAVNAPPPRLA